MTKVKTVNSSSCTTINKRSSIEEDHITHLNIVEEVVAIIIIKNSKPFSFLLNLSRNRDASLPMVKVGVKLPAINSNILYSPNLQNLNKAKISQIERTYVSNDGLNVLKRRKHKGRSRNKKHLQYKKEFEQDVKLL